MEGISEAANQAVLKFLTGPYIRRIVEPSILELKERGVKQSTLWQFTDEFDANNVKWRTKFDASEVFKLESYRIGIGAEVYLRMKPDGATDASDEIFVSASGFLAGIEAGSVIKVEERRE